MDDGLVDCWSPGGCTASCLDSLQVMMQSYLQFASICCSCLVLVLLGVEGRREGGDWELTRRADGRSLWDKSEARHTHTHTHTQRERERDGTSNVWRVVLVQRQPCVRGVMAQHERIVPEGRRYILAHYVVLGVSPFATKEEIRDAYRRVSREWVSDGSGSLGDGRDAGHCRQETHKLHGVSYHTGVLSLCVQAHPDRRVLQSSNLMAEINMAKDTLLDDEKRHEGIHANYQKYRSEARQKNYEEVREREGMEGGRDRGEKAVGAL